MHTKPGEGTTFELYLPIAAESVVATMPTLREPPRGQGELILVADDEAAILEINRATLGCYGYRTVCARDGAEAVALFCQQPDDISLVIIYSQMPFMDGPAVLQALRKVRPHVKCVLTSASEIKSAFPTDGPLPPFLAKPFTSGQLLEVLDRELHSS